MALFIKKNNQLVKVGEVAKALEPDKLDLRLAQTTNYTYENNSITELPHYAFYKDSHLTSISCPNVTKLNNSVFYENYNLETVYFPKLTETTNSYTFKSCLKLTTVNFPLLTKLGNNTFEQSNISTVNFPELTYMGGSVFAKCSYLTSISLPKITLVNQYDFDSCSNLENLDFPLVTTIGASAFYKCSSLVNIFATAFPEATEIQGSAFYQCSNLQTVVFPKVTSIAGSAFYNCNWLRTITLGASTVCTLAATNAIPATSSHHVTIYVPSNLVESYKTATNWSTLYNNGYITFSAIGTETGYTLSVANFNNSVNSSYYFTYSFDGSNRKEFKANTVLYNVTNIYIVGNYMPNSVVANSHFISTKMGANMTPATALTLFTLTQDVDDIDILIANH